MNFNHLLKTTYRQVIAEHNDARLYEMQAQMTTDENGKLSVKNANIAFGLDNSSLIAVYCNGETTYTTHGSPWIEDKPITPYLPGLGPVIKYLKQRCYVDLVNPKVTLRHQIDPLHIEPQYIISENGVTYYVGVWSHDIEVTMKGCGDGYKYLENEDE